MKCVIVQRIHACGLETLRAGGVEPLIAPSTDLTELAPLLKRAAAAITRNWGFPQAAVDLAPDLRVLGVHGTGTDRVDRQALTARGIALVSTPGANAQSVAEHALGLILAVARGIPGGDQAMRQGDFGFRETFRGVELSGLTLGLWGWGYVASALAPLARGLGMEVLVWSAHADDSDFSSRGIKRARSVAHLLEVSDVLSLHGRPGVAPVLGASELSRMPKGAILINTARGALVDEAALAAALRSGHLFGAGLDVLTQEPPGPDTPLHGCPRLIMTPHVGGSTEAALRRTAQAVATQVVSALLAAP
jgi:phosphoglycerate dehydrogenase-like enzyme